MTILQRYLLREWFLTLLAVTVVLMIVLMGLFLGELLNDLADGRVPSGLLGLQLLLRMPEALVNILPLSGFVAVMWGLGRLYRDQEMAVMRSSGFGWRQMLRPLTTLVAPVAGILLIIAFTIAPRAAAVAELKLEEAFKSAAIWGLQEGRFHSLQKGALVIYVESLSDDGQGLSNIFIRQRDDERETIWIAQSGRYWMDAESGQRFLTMEDGQITDAVYNQLDVRLLTFERNDFKLPEPELRKKKKNMGALYTSDLLLLGGKESFAELQWRVAPAILIIVLGLLAIPLSHSEPTEGRGIRVVLGILSYAIYANTLYLCRVWIADGAIPPVLGMWWVHGLVFLVALWWLQRQGRMVGS